MSIKQQPNIVSVDLGQSSLNMTFTTGNGVVLKATTVKLQEGVIQNMRLRAPEMLTAALLEAKGKGKINGKNCVLCLGGREIIIRYFKFPKMSDAHLYENVVSEISSYLPFSSDDYTIDFCVKDVLKEEDSIQLNVMAVAIHNDVIIPYIDAFKRAGLRIVRVDIKENAYEKVIKAIQLRSGSETKNFSIIDIGASSTTISTYYNGSFYINNTMAYGGNNFTETIAKLYKIDTIQAEERKLILSQQNYSEQDKEIIDLMNAFFERILTEANKVFEFYRKENNAQIEEIFLCGGSSVISGLTGYIEASTDLPTTELREVIQNMFTSKLIEQGSINLELFPASIGASYREVD